MEVVHYGPFVPHPQYDAQYFDALRDYRSVGRYAQRIDRRGAESGHKPGLPQGLLYDEILPVTAFEEIDRQDLPVVRLPVEAVGMPLEKTHAPPAAAFDRRLDHDPVIRVAQAVEGAVVRADRCVVRIRPPSAKVAQHRRGKPPGGEKPVVNVLVLVIRSVFDRVEHRFDPVVAEAFGHDVRPQADVAAEKPEIFTRYVPVECTPFVHISGFDLRVGPGFPPPFIRHMRR